MPLSQSVEQVAGLTLKLLLEIRLITELRTPGAVEILFGLCERFLLNISAAAVIHVLMVLEDGAYVLLVKRQRSFAV